ncbi:MAG: hypothetical protein ACOYMA_05645 [Bacteroidia bacterium]
MRLKILFSTLLISHFCEAQNAISKNELGLNLYGNEYVSGNIIRIDGIKHFTLNGIQFKRNLNNKYLLRFNISYSSNEISKHENSGMTRSESKNVQKLFDTKFGFEKVFLTGKVKPFSFIDFGYRIDGNKGSFAYNSEFPPYDFSGSYDRTNYYLNASIGFGLKCYPTNHIYLSAETCVGFHREIFDGGINPTYYQFINPINTFVFGVRF